MEFIWILVAFGCGFIAKHLNLPPLIGYLVAGFGLNAAGVVAHPGLQVLADLGITLMLFTIGLKLHLKDLMRPGVWAGTSLHTLLWMIAAGLLFFIFTLFGLPHFSGLSVASCALIAFALSFSSTVCVVKLLEDKGELKTSHGKLAIGILVMQDIIAVLFLVAATGKMPSIYSPLLLLLIPATPLIGRLLSSAGHGELLPLTGFLLAIGGYELFHLLDLKGDLGALVMGILLSNHSKGTELAKSLLSFKDLFLIGFFLSIGFIALPDISMFWPVMILTALLLLKSALLFGLLAGLREPTRVQFLASLTLMNYSEFGLIVAALSVNAGWLSKEWLVLIALAVSLSFIITSLGYEHAHARYARWKNLLKRFERRQKPPAYARALKDARVLVIGMGRVGIGAYNALQKELGDKVWGVDADSDKIAQHAKAGRHVLVADAEDAEFWERTAQCEIELVMLAIPSINDIREIKTQLQMANFKGKVAAIARFEDERQQLLDFGIDRVFNFFAEAGTGFAEESLQLLQHPQQIIDLTQG